MTDYLWAKTENVQKMDKKPQKDLSKYCNLKVK